MPPAEQDERLKRMDQFIANIDLEALCRKNRWQFKVADVKLRAFAVTVELLVRESPERRVIVRFPFDTTDKAGEETTLSYVSTLTWLRTFTDIPVPKVFSVVLKSNPGNVLGHTYTTMERVPGHNLRPYTGSDFSDNSPELVGYRKVYRAVAYMMCIMACKSNFLKIGALRTNEYNYITVGPYVHPKWTGSLQVALLYDKFPEVLRGPYETQVDYYKALAAFTKVVGIHSAPWVRERDLFLACSLLVDEINLGRARPLEFHNGPFWLEHDQLSLENIFVDDDFNVTGYIEFPGTVVPAPSQASYPLFFSDATAGLFKDREAFLRIFTDTLRRLGLSFQARLQRTQFLAESRSRKMIELAIRGSQPIRTLAHVYPKRFSQPFEIQSELGRIAITSYWFQMHTHQDQDGLYSWERIVPASDVAGIAYIMNAEATLNGTGGQLANSESCLTLNAPHIPNGVGDTYFASYPNLTGFVEREDPVPLVYYPNFTDNPQIAAPVPVKYYPNVVGQIENTVQFQSPPNFAGIAEIQDPVLPEQYSDYGSAAQMTPKSFRESLPKPEAPNVSHVDNWVNDVAHARADAEHQLEQQQMDSAVCQLQHAAAQVEFAAQQVKLMDFKVQLVPGNAQEA